MSFIKNPNIDTANFNNNNGLANISDVIDFITESLSNSNLFYELELAEVIDVVNSENHKDFNNNIGFLKVRLLKSSYNKVDSIIFCKPFHFGSILTYPLLHEIVFVAELNEPNLYNNNVDIMNHYWLSVFKFNNDLFKNLAINYSLKDIDENNDLNNSELINKYSVNNNLTPKFKLGDTVFYGRFNQKLEFTHNEENYEPETNLKTNTNILQQLTNQSIKVISDISNEQYESTDFSDAGDTQLLESDNIIIQSNKKTIIGAEEEINISSNKNTNIQAKKNVILDAKKIYLGSKAEQQAILGNELKNILSDIIDEISNIKVICTSPGSTSSPIINIINVKALKLKLNNILSKYIYIK